MGKEIVIPESFTRALDEIPIANDQMSPEMLRRICTDYMRLQLTFPWQTKEDYAFSHGKPGRVTLISKSTLYGGLPYITGGNGNLYRVAEFYNEEERSIDLSSFRENPEWFGNTCSGAACCAWARAISSVKRFGGTAEMTRYNGYLPVGPYTYDKETECFVKSTKESKRERDYTPRTVCQENGARTMYHSYAALRAGDGLLSRAHVRMVAREAEVVYDPDGNVVPGESFVYFLDQVMTQKVKQLPDGSTIRIQGSVDVPISFYSLFKDGYIPFTFAELIGEKRAERACVEKNLPDGLWGKGEESLQIHSNYPISDAYLTLFDEKGEEIFYEALRSSDFIVRKMDLSPLYEKGRRAARERDAKTVLVTCRLLNGELLTLYEGKI
ncbi:MAG: hypothetical protein IKC69_06860 [Clostridia bacterium]|nr:hypothetical protein [Clostridia bacterium]